MLGRILALGRYTAVLAVIGSFIGSIILYLYGVYDLILIVQDISTYWRDPDALQKFLITDMIGRIDIFLLGTVLYIIAVGLYELFIKDDLPLPAWIQIHDLDDLKEKLITGVIVVLAVYFLSQALKPEAQEYLLDQGLAIGVIIAALTFYLRVKGGHEKSGSK